MARKSKNGCDYEDNIETMKLEKITIDGIEYYQWVFISSKYPFKNFIGDLFSDWHDIPLEKVKFIGQLKINNI